jgi:predicted NUDIX family NTP pyrophosphohydrolase
VLRCIDGAIPFPIVFELTQGQVDEARTQVVAAYKRSSDTLSASLVCSEYFESDWMPASAEREQLPFALDLAGLYEQLLYRLVPIGPRTQEPLRDLIARAEAARSKAIEIAKAKSRLAKEKQFNRKVDINTKLRQLKTELEQMNR